ncbi:SepM family pheromone-processing serine protease [Lacticaseibacillus saniviri]|uniref:S16 family peptidase n=1 Tax=Lacticaseibacillus saniviri JCM 17471 = DSM 24301 TaxID=1293598 RepID=A0A0R2MZR8_9LACO|nr:SepM family pheromone-processing serine protease [Lacticaseibacillus saniviri]KRO18332.1 S16 family peptidase [Lacticaseibacillus saniviri JCM 17471 = DSM 24301]
MKRRRVVRFSLITVLIVAVMGFFLFPTNQYLEEPGGADNLKPLVTVTGKTDKAAGQYLLMTVGIVGPASPAMLVWGHFRPFTDQISKQELMGDDNTATYNQLQKYYIESAANNAIGAAFKQAHKPVTVNHEGIYVLSKLANSPFKQLAVGDTITALNGKTYQSADDYVNAIKKRSVGSQLAITYKHKGQVKHETAKLIRLPGTKKAGIGITLTENTQVTTKPKVSIDAGDIGGPSAGLMFALQVYTTISEPNLRAGRMIAGTGTMALDGTVGQIGGIDKKVAAADAKGATIFFAPNQPATKAIKKIDPTYVNNYDDAKKAAATLHTKMKIVPVKTLQDAIDYLKR